MTYYAAPYSAPDGCRSLALYRTREDGTDEYAWGHGILRRDATREDILADARQFVRNSGLIWLTYAQIESDEGRIARNASGWMLFDPDEADAPVPAPTARETLTRMWGDLFATARQQGWQSGMSTFATEHGVYLLVRRVIELPNAYGLNSTEEARKIVTLLADESRSYVTVRWDDDVSLNSDDDMTRLRSEYTARVRFNEEPDETTAERLIEELWEQLDEKAADESWCGVYDAFCERFDRERPQEDRDYLVDATAEVTLTIRVPVSTTVSARSADQATEDVSDSDFEVDADSIAAALGIDYSTARNLDWDVNDIEVESAEPA
jgi:hypothetical protein